MYILNGILGSPLHKVTLYNNLRLVVFFKKKNILSKYITFLYLQTTQELQILHLNVIKLN